MAFRDKWLANTGCISRHSEVFLHVADREVPLVPQRMLLVGVENGGDVEIWRDLLPEGSEVVAIDSNAACEALNLGVHVGCVEDHDWLFEVLAHESFDVVIWADLQNPRFIWPWIAAGGRLIIERMHGPVPANLANRVFRDEESWLPQEEIMRVTTYPGIVVVEKRGPRVMPYMDLMTGNFADVLPEQELIAMGVKRVLVD